MQNSTSENFAISVIIPNWNGKKWLHGCLNALAAQSFKDFEVVLVDNASSDGSQKLAIELFSKTRVIQLPENKGFATAVNAGIESTTSPLVALLNNDTVPAPDWLESLVAAMEQAGPACGSIASLMLNMDNPDLVENAGDILTTHGLALKRGRNEPASKFNAPAKILSACAGAALYRRTMLDAVGRFDDSFFAYLEDVDLGLRARLMGYDCVYAPAAKIRHKSHGTGMPKARYARLIARNRLMLLYKNIPSKILQRLLPSLITGSIMMLVGHRRPRHTIAGCLDFLNLKPTLREKRKHILEKTLLSEKEIENLFLTATSQS